MRLRCFVMRLVNLRRRYLHVHKLRNQDLVSGCQILSLVATKLADSEIRCTLHSVLKKYVHTHD